MMRTTVTALLLLALIALVLAAVGCGKKSGPPPGEPNITTPPPGPEAETPQAAEPKAEQPGGEATQPEAKTEEKGTSEGQSETGGETEGKSSDKPPKAKLSDDQFVKLMGDLAVAIKRVGDQKLPPDQAEAELEKVAEKYGLSLEEVETEAKAHQVGTPEEQQAFGMRVLQHMQKRIEEEEKKTGKK